MAKEFNSRTGLTDAEAQEFQAWIMRGFLVFTVIAIVAHVLVWMWRPWFPGEDGYSMLMELNQSINQAVHHTRLT
ncbi:MAG: light-harvesting antenna LH1, beta subunit [Myxococcota bacterium]